MSAVCRSLLRASVRPVPGFVSVNSRLCSSTASSASSTKPTQEQQKVKTSIQRPAPSASHDWIGPPNRLSNMRPIVYRAPDRETQLEKRLRTLRQETEDWNHDFWTKQNVTFSQEKESFIASQLRAKGLSRRDEQGRNRSLDSEEIAVFYKNFLDTNRTRHANYNKEWYRRNFTITFLMARVTLQNMWNNLSPANGGKKNDPTT
uniref:Cytochrome c oxidase assembly factor 8 n=1 Tax=Neogobius melanostomus TaxID=47308 RepID=A0A8C6S6C7_9GOBI